MASIEGFISRMVESGLPSLKEPPVDKKNPEEIEPGKHIVFASRPFWQRSVSRREMFWWGALTGAGLGLDVLVFYSLPTPERPRGFVDNFKGYKNER